MAATDLERLVVSLDADIRKFEKELKRANNIADGQFRDIERKGTRASKNLSNAFGKLSLGSIGKNAFAGFAAGAVSALAPIAVLTAAINGTRKALADFGKIADDIKPTGLKPELYQALSLAALEAGSSQEELNAALLIFSKNVGLAQSGTGPLVAGLQKLNPVLLKNILAAKDQDERIRLVSEAMKKMGDSTRQAALASVAFGRGGVKIVEALKGGSAAIDEFIRKGKEMGVLLTQSDLDQADELADKMDVLAFAIDTNLNKALINLAPLLVAGASGLNKFAKAAADLSNSQVTLEGLATLLGPQLRLIDPSGNLGAGISKVTAEADALIEKMTTGSQTVQALAGDIKQAFADIPRDMITSEQIASLDALTSKLGENGEGAEDVKRKLQELAKSNPEFIALADRLTPLLDKLIAIQTAAAGAGTALGALDDKRITDRSGGEVSDFFAGRQADAGRSSSERELDARTEQVINDAKEKDIELTQEAARAEAELELARDAAVKASEKGDNGALKEANDERERQTKLIRDTIGSLQEETASIGFETEHLNDNNAAREQARVVFETLNRLQAEGITITDDLRAAVEREAVARGQQVAAYDAAEAATEKLRQAQEDLAERQAEVNDAFRDSFKGFIHDLAEGKSLTDSLSDALGRLGDRLLDMALDDLFGRSGDSGFGLLGELFGIASGKGGASNVSSFKTSGTLTGGGGVDTLLGGLTGSISQNAAAIRKIESGSYAGNYSALGQIIPKTGDRAYGAYQVMGANVGPWSEKWLGQRMTPSEFLKNPAAQDKIFAGQFGSYADKWGAGKAANAWFTGSPEGHGSDPLGTSSTDYVAKFETALKGAPAALDDVTTASQGAAEAITDSTQTAASSLGNLSTSVGDATSNLGKFGSSLLNAFPAAPSGGGGLFGGLFGSLFGGGGGTGVNLTNTLSPTTLSILAGAPGGLYAEGGYTGDMGTNMAAGIVHGGEFVVNANATARNRALLEALNNGLPGYAAGGLVLPKMNRGRSGGGGNWGRQAPNVSITVVTPDAPSFMRSQNQIANKTASTVDRAYRIT